MKKILLLCALTTQFTFAAANDEPWREFGITEAEYWHNIINTTEQPVTYPVTYDDFDSDEEAQRLQRQFDDEEATRLVLEKIRQEEVFLEEARRLQRQFDDEEATRLELEKIRQEEVFLEEARRLQRQLEDEEEEQIERTQYEKYLQEQASQAEIQRIQDEETAQPQPHYQPAKKTIFIPCFRALEDEDRALYHPILLNFHYFDHLSNLLTDGLDVHETTKTFARKHYLNISYLEKKYLGYTTGALFTYDQFKMTLETNNPSMDLILKKSDLYINGADSETQQKLRTVFEEVYTMAVRMDESDPTRPNYMRLIEKMIENIETGGGCHPGVTGRLIALYATMLIEKFGRQGLDI